MPVDTICIRIIQGDLQGPRPESHLSPESQVMTMNTPG